MNAPPLLEAVDVSVVYPTPRGPITAVDRVSLTLAAGESLAILGRSVSGKSTLLATLAGLCLPTVGEVRFRGRSWSKFSPRETQVARAGAIGLVLQDAGLLPGLRAFDNVLLPLERGRCEAVRVQRRLAEEMALQDLRADLDDVAVTDDFRCRATLFLENVRPARPLHVLGPRVDVAIQRDGRWESVLFERDDAYYVYLRDPRLTEVEVREANGWGPKATVPVWIGMPAH